MTFCHDLPMRQAHTPTLPELDAFAATARTGSVSRAADALGLTQSAISRSIKSLESRLGVALFHRDRQRLVLSDAGRAFLPEAEALLVALDRAALGIMSFGGHGSVLRLACLPTFAQVWLVPRLADFATAAPDVTFDLTAILTAPDFARDPCDAAILRGPAPPGGGALTLAEDRLVAVAAPALVPGGGLPDAALARLPLLQQATRPDLWLAWFRDGGGDPLRLLRGPRFETFGMVLAAARAGLGAALVPEVLAGPDLAAGTLRRASPRSMAGTAPYRLVWPARSRTLPVLARFRAHLGAAAPAPRPDDAPA
ncbi:MAG TPA: LysR substrate-binding domain-containing protein [Paracoccaceae bacterium]|nr:LysR substrate-binding domain-containing protein [Paracoccaceae bacterium]